MSLTVIMKETLFSPHGLPLLVNTNDKFLETWVFSKLALNSWYF